MAFNFIDLFAGCGGFSLGFRAAGFQEKLAVERSGMAAETYIHNLVQTLPDCASEDKTGFKDRIDAIQRLQHLTALYEIEDNQSREERNEKRLNALRGKVQSLEEKVKNEFCEFVSKDGARLIVDDINNVNIRAKKNPKNFQADVVVGGPPCQGFSLAGKRAGDNDPRNSLVHSFREFIFVTKPKIFVMENVLGIGSKFKDKDSSILKDIETYFQSRFHTSPIKVNAKYHCVPQSRPRRLLIGISKEATKHFKQEFIENVMHELKRALDVDFRVDSNAERYTTEQALPFPLQKNSSYKKQLDKLAAHVQAHNDNGESHNHEKRAHAASTVQRFKIYQELAKTGNESLISLRWARPKDKKSYWFKRLNEMGNEGWIEVIDLKAVDSELSEKQVREINKKLKRARLKEIETQVDPDLHARIKKSESIFTSKHSQRVLPQRQCSPTIMTIPDDYVHYKEPRTLTVREMARLQSFPDQFVFRGKVTTGGKLRKHQVPQYTQVGNAVPPLLALATAKTILSILKKL